MWSQVRIEQARAGRRDATRGGVASADKQSMRTFGPAGRDQHALLSILLHLRPTVTLDALRLPLIPTS